MTDYGRQPFTGRIVHMMPEKFDPISRGQICYFIEPDIPTQVGEVLSIRELQLNNGSTSSAGQDLELIYPWRWQETGRIIEARVTHISTNAKGIKDRFQVVSFNVLYQYNDQAQQNQLHGKGVEGAHGQQGYGYRGTQWEPGS